MIMNPFFTFTEILVSGSTTGNPNLRHLLWSLSCFPVSVPIVEVRKQIGGVSAWELQSHQVAQAGLVPRTSNSSFMSLQRKD